MACILPGRLDPTLVVSLKEKDYPRPDIAKCKFKALIEFSSHINQLFLEAKHCPSSSDVRALISTPLPSCQRETILRLFDESYRSEDPTCSCCYSCMKQHSDHGCEKCYDFLETFFSQKSKVKVTKSVAATLKEAMEELFTALNMENLLVENELKVFSKDFIKDFIKMSDEIRTEQDIVDMWHIDPAVAHPVFLLFTEVLFEGFNIPSDSDCENEESDPDSDILDQSSDSD